MTHQVSSHLILPPSSNLSRTDYATLLRELRLAWRRHQRTGLESRYRLGNLLNNQLGPPDQQQPYGQGIVERVAKFLCIDPTDIGRFRRFASMFESFDTFKQRHPKIRCWTEVREMIAHPRRRVTGNRSVQGLLRSVATATQSLRRLESVDGPKVDQLRSALQELFVEAKCRLKLDLAAS